MNLTVYRPNVTECKVKYLPMELQRMKNSRLILLIIPAHCRGTAFMALAAYLIGLKAKLILCIHPLPSGVSLFGEKVIKY